MMNQLKKYFFTGLWVFVLGVGVIGCREKEEPVRSLDFQVNTWIEDVMNQIYYWLDDMRRPISKESSPEDYFESLLFRPTDRFSAIFPDYQELTNNLQGISLEAGYEILLARESNRNDNIIAFVTYVKKNSPAKEAGILRGDLITHINGTQMTLANYRQLLGTISNSHTITARRYSETEESYLPLGDFALNTIVLAENPNFLDTVYTINNEKIGYVVYHFFAPGVAESPKRYDDQMDAIFAKFKAEGIQHLILDFRYNSGGFVNSAVNLASLIAPGVTNQDIFSKTKFNSFVMSFDDFKNVQTPFITKSQNLGPILSGNRVYILTSSRTASASELIINGLLPYMDVVLIGDVTTGKNVGSVPIEDEDNAENRYGLLPIVSMVFNKNDQSDFTNGFTPDFEAIELTQPFLRQFGDTREYLLSVALEQITGIPSSSVDSRKLFFDRQDVYSSLENKVRHGRLIEDKEKFAPHLKKILNQPHY